MDEVELTLMKAAAWDALQQLPPGAADKIKERDQAEHLVREIARSTLANWGHDESEVLFTVSGKMLLDLCNVLGVKGDVTEALRR